MQKIARHRKEKTQKPDRRKTLKIVGSSFDVSFWLLGVLLEIEGLLVKLVAAAYETEALICWVWGTEDVFWLFSIPLQYREINTVSLWRNWRKVQPSRRGFLDSWSPSEGKFAVRSPCLYIFKRCSLRGPRATWQDGKTLCGMGQVSRSYLLFLG